MEQIIEQPMGIRRVRMSEYQLTDALETFSLRNAQPRVLYSQTTSGKNQNAANSQPISVNDPGDDVERTTLSKPKAKTIKPKIAKKKSAAGKRVSAVKVVHTLSLDADVVAFFRASGRGASTRINAILRAVVEAAGGSQVLA